MSRYTLFTAFLVLCTFTIVTPLQGSWLGYLLTGERTTNASNHPAAKEIIGKRIRTRRISFVIKYGDDLGDLELNPVGHGFSFQPDSLDEYYRQVKDETLDSSILGVVEEESILKIVAVDLYENRKFNIRTLSPLVVIETGQFKGYKVNASAFLRAELSINDHMRLDERFGEFVDPQQLNSDSKGSSS